MAATVRLLAVVLAVGACSSASPRDEPTAAPTDGAAWAYDVVLSDDLARMDVRMTFAGEPPPRLVLGDDRGLAALSTSLRRVGSSLATDGVSTVQYRVDVARLLDDGPAVRVGGSRCVAPGLWLLRPMRLPDGARATLTLHASEGVDLSVPWPRRARGAYVLDETAFRWKSFAAFGRLETHDVEVSGATLHVAVLDRSRAATWPGIERWLTTAADAQTSLYGVFPVHEAQVVVKPVSSKAPCAFGETLRGGGAGVVLHMSDEAKDGELPGEWVAVHEFVHLGMPAIADDDAWMSEGFVTWYQEVLRGRAGLLDERATWDHIVDGFARGRADRGAGTLAETSAAMGRLHAYQRVYWSGAAIALLLDVELRRSSDGTKSLDDAIREVRRAFDGRPRELRTSEILARLDPWLGRPLFSETAAKWLASAEFPEVGETLARLGVVVRDGRVERLDDAAPEAGLRAAIGAPRTK